MAKNAAKEAAERFVSATELAQWIDVSRPYVNKREGVVRRTPKGYPLSRSIIDYVRHLRRERPPSRRRAESVILDARPSCLCELAGRLT